MVADLSSLEERLARITFNLHHVHLIGVGGSAMAALAGMLAEAGFQVTGSDHQLYEPADSMLRRLGLQIQQGYGAANLEPRPDLAVIGNVITRVNPEVEALLASDIPYLSMPEALRHFFLENRRVLMVAGTHGKTTSTAMMARVLELAGRSPSMLLGGVARDFSANYRLGHGPDFVIEGDEYDTAFFDKGPKFMHYQPAGAIITAVEFDHADIYRDLDHVKSAFRALTGQRGPDDVLVVSADCPAALEISEGIRARRLTFGCEHGDFRATDVECGPGGTCFSITQDGARVARGIRLTIPGRMNVANALGVWVLLKQFDVDDQELAQGLAAFNGVVRRQDVIGEAGGIIVIDDFAHHPTAVRATLAALGECYPGRRLLVAFEPRSNSVRRAVFQDDLSNAFSLAARVYLAPVFFKENDPIPPASRLNTQVLARAVSRRGVPAFACESVAEIVERMTADSQPGDVLICLSNGPFANLPHRLLNAASHTAGQV